LVTCCQLQLSHKWISYIALYICLLHTNPKSLVAYYLLQVQNINIDTDTIHASVSPCPRYTSRCYPHNTCICIALSQIHFPLLPTQYMHLDYPVPDTIPAVTHTIHASVSPCPRYTSRCYPHNTCICITLSQIHFPLLPTQYMHLYRPVPCTRPAVTHIIHASVSPCLRYTSRCYPHNTCICIALSQVHVPLLPT